MEKWADYYISAVGYDEKENIIKVRVKNSKAGKLEPPMEWTRENIVSAIGEGKTFVTVFYRDYRWHKGQDVQIITVDEVMYIRTDKNRTAADNLESLPEF
ncbi:MAG: DUF3892 domain-containing protein [Anaerolineales bacterium]|nr:DUF3892 domain-containing protein [Anaerolineales bacterium]